MTPPRVSDPAVTDRPASRWALATFLLGLVSLIPLSLLAGIVALIKTRGGKEPGRGLAVAGIVICALWTAVWAYSFWPKSGLITGTVQSDRVGVARERVGRDHGIAEPSTIVLGVEIPRPALPTGVEKVDAEAIRRPDRPAHLGGQPVGQLRIGVR